MKLSLLSLAAFVGSAVATSLDPVIIKVRRLAQYQVSRLTRLGVQILLL